MRALAVRHVDGARDRAAQVSAFGARRDRFRAANCRYWVFEDAARLGAFIEFVEADGPDALARAHAAVGAEPGPVYLEVELA